MLDFYFYTNCIYEQRIVAGLKVWEKSDVVIQGVTANIKVNVSPTRSISNNANIKFNLTKDGRGITLSASGWRPGEALGFSVPIGDKYTFEKPHSTGVDSVSIIAAHEFGHVLGVMDAYPEVYNYYAEVPLDRADTYNIMRCNYYAFPTFENLHEMILYAWKDSMMQGYTNELFAVESQAFFH